MDLTKLSNPFYNKNYRLVGEIIYEGILINNNLKIMFFIAFFLSMPVMILADFLLIHCCGIT